MADLTRISAEREAAIRRWHFGIFGWHLGPLPGQSWDDFPEARAHRLSRKYGNHLGAYDTSWIGAEHIHRA